MFCTYFQGDWFHFSFAITYIRRWLCRPDILFQFYLLDLWEFLYKFLFITGWHSVLLHTFNSMHIYVVKYGGNWGKIPQLGHKRSLIVWHKGFSCWMTVTKLLKLACWAQLPLISENQILLNLEILTLLLDSRITSTVEQKRNYWTWSNNESQRDGRTLDRQMIL